MFKKLSKKLLVAYAEAKEIAKDNRKKSTEKKERKKQEKEQERQGSVNCPYCKKHFSSQCIYKNEIKVKELDLRERDSETWIYISFINCKECNQIFGIKESFHTMMDVNYRTAFSLKE